MRAELSIEMLGDNTKGIIVANSGNPLQILDVTVTQEDEDSLGYYSRYFRTSAIIPRTIRPTPMNHLMRSGNAKTSIPRIIAITPIHVPVIFMMIPPDGLDN